MSYMGEQPIFGSYPSQLLSGDGSTTSFTLTYSPASPTTLLITISGVKQQATAYSVTDTALDFGAGNAPPSGTNNIEILYLGQRSDVGTVADDSITLAKMAGLVRGKIIYGDASGDPAALTVGTANQVLKSDGTDVSWGAAGGGMQSIQTFAATATWTRPANITKALVKIVGAGGGGGCGAGAGAGAFSEKLIDVSSISTSTVTIGAGGVGDNGQAPGGNVGGVSSWVDGTNTLSCGGGLAPTYVSTGYKGGLGGVATGGDINIAGGDSDPHMDSSYIEQLGSTGGASFFGGGGAGGVAQSGLYEGEDARAYGAGGGGAQSSGVYSGGDGAVGFCIVYEFK